MKIEYLLFNLIVLIGPLALSFDRTVRYHRYWPQAFLSLGIVMIPFLVWDIYANGFFWWFNDAYVLPLRILGLPPGEVLFFISVPFSCLFIWQIIVTHRQEVGGGNKVILYLLAALAALTAGVFLLRGLLYTAFVFILLALTVALDLVLRTHLLLQKRTYLYLGIVTALMFLFNGYLTARPVVLYGERYFTGIRLWTIPVEDFGYGYGLILLCTVIFERVKGRRHG